MTQRPWMPLYWSDYRRDTTHLTAEQDGAYLLLIGYYWDNGHLPLTVAERQAVSKISRAKWKNVWGVIGRFWDEQGHHKRIDVEIEKCENIRNQRAVAGHKGGKVSQQMLQANARLNGQANARAIAPHTTQRNTTSPTLSLERKSKIEPSRELDDLVKKQNGHHPGNAGSLATALPSGALRSPAHAINPSDDGEEMPF